MWSMLPPEHLPQRVPLKKCCIIEVPLVHIKDIYRIARNQPKHSPGVNKECSRNQQWDTPLNGTIPWGNAPSRICRVCFAGSAGGVHLIKGTHQLVPKPR